VIARHPEERGDEGSAVVDRSRSLASLRMTV
jgi:hypothetical protein